KISSWRRRSDHDVPFAGPYGREAARQGRRGSGEGAAMPPPDPSAPDPGASAAALGRPRGGTGNPRPCGHYRHNLVSGGSLQVGAIIRTPTQACQGRPAGPTIILKWVSPSGGNRCWKQGETGARSASRAALRE